MRKSGIARSAGLPAWSGLRGYAACVLACLLMLTGPARAAGDPYRVGPGDVLNVSIFGQPDISGPQTVRPEGTLTLHLLGALQVAGETPEEIEGQIGERVREVLNSSPSIIVDVAEYRKVYILGDVDRPGAYPFVPGMTTLMAVATAGGLRRITLDDDRQAARLFDEERQVMVSRARVAELTADVASLDRELASADKGAGGGSDDPLLQAQRRMLETQLAASEDRRKLAQSEVDTLARVQESLQTRLDQQQKLLDAGQSGGGYFPAEKQERLQAEVDRLRENLLEVVASAARAQRDLADSSSESVVAKMRYLQDLQAQRADAARQIEQEQVALDASAALVTQLGGTGTGEIVTRNSYVVQRKADGAVAELSLGGNDGLHPEDVLLVTVQVQPADAAAALTR